MQASASTKTATILPDEIIFYILHFLNPREVIRLRLVCSAASQTQSRLFPDHLS